MGVKRASFPSLALAMPLILTAIFAVQAQDYRARVSGSRVGPDTSRCLGRQGHA